MTAPKSDACSSATLFAEVFFGDQLRGGAAAPLWPEALVEEVVAAAQTRAQAEYA